jgi:hypothetical protein
LSKTAIVVTVGSPKESLGALKLAAWLRRIGYTVEERTELQTGDSGRDLYCFSVVFSWRLPAMVTMAKWAVRWGEVWIGGPAVTFHAANARFVETETGVKPHKGIDERFEREPGDYKMVYFSRGCPAYTPACGLCPVPRIEGTEFRFYPEANPSKMLLDNNLSALPAEYQDHIIDRYTKEWTGGKVDANSGFEPHTFNEEILLRWQKFPLLFWRFGYDDITERDQALEMMRLLKFYGYSGEKVRVYTIIGNEPIATCIQRIKEVIANDMHPWPQRLRPLDWLGPDGTLPCRFDWDEPTLIACQRFYSFAGLWKKNKPEDFYYQSRYPLRQENQKVVNP